ncbi:putative protein YDR124W [Talaromyces islandicus]|uniref:Subtelomeric hrmA-associated cluster protein AFUB-079030/YDR124W-like helical bundle domain-containing protein n=1 Tax=Talaromyces islandicus TaxID=28573 RepID=A0A0U1MD86_TALIS|nr:putative protein YDR124W [Talaromyces islandicus]
MAKILIRPVSQRTEMTKSPSSASRTQENRTQTLESAVVFTGAVPPFWAIMYMDDKGNIGESSNLMSNVFPPGVYQNFRNASELVAQSDPQPMIPNSSALDFGSSRSSQRNGRLKRRRGNVREEPLAVKSMETFDDEMDLVALKIGDTKKVTAYYESAFKRLQQLNCRMLAKGFIRLIEPRKQVRHPYNGGRGSAPGEKGDPESTKPDWWPSDVTHREPDHLRKELRLKLLVHIIQKLLPMGITADKLEEVANDNRRQIKPSAKVGILDELARVNFSIDANAVIYVIDHDGVKKNEPGSDGEEEPEDDADGLKTPPDTPNVQGPHDSSSTDAFQIPPDLRFGSQDGQMQFQSSQPGVGHQSLATTTPIPAPVMTPAPDQFMSHSPFASPSQAQPQPMIHPQMNAQNSFSGWPPAFQPNMFGPVDYTGLNRQQMAYPAYTSCPAPPIHPGPSPHTIPDLDR